MIYIKKKGYINLQCLKYSQLGCRWRIEDEKSWISTSGGGTGFPQPITCPNSIFTISRWFIVTRRFLWGCSCSRLLFQLITISRRPLYIHTYIYIEREWERERDKIICKPTKKCKLLNLLNHIKIIWNVSIFHIFKIINFPYISYFHIFYESISSLDYFDIRRWWGFIV